MFYRFHYDHTNFSCLEDLPGLGLVLFLASAMLCLSREVYESSNLG